MRPATGEVGPYQLFMLALCVLVLVSLGAEALFTLDPDTRLILSYTDTAVCLIFFADFLYSLFTADRRLRYLYTWGWVDLVSSIPALPYVRWGRAARLTRILRLMRGVRSARTLGSFILEYRAKSTVLAAAMIALLAIVFGSIAVLNVERAAGGNIQTGSGALWWSVVTVTTVGYGDRFPTTTEGRVIASALMAVGIGLYGTFTAFIASWFMKPTEDEQGRDIDELRCDVREIRRLLESRSIRP